MLDPLTARIKIVQVRDEMLVRIKALQGQVEGLNLALELLDREAPAAPGFPSQDPGT